MELRADRDSSRSRESQLPRGTKRAGLNIEALSHHRLHRFRLSNDSSRYFRRFPGGFACFTFLARRERVASIAERETAADRHQHGPIPDPANKRLIVNTHTPRARTNR